MERKSIRNVVMFSCNPISNLSTIQPEAESQAIMFINNMLAHRIACFRPSDMLHHTGEI